MLPMQYSEEMKAKGFKELYSGEQVRQHNEQHGHKGFITTQKVNSWTQAVIFDNGTEKAFWYLHS